MPLQRVMIGSGSWARNRRRIRFADERKGTCGYRRFYSVSLINARQVSIKYGCWPIMPLSPRVPQVPAIKDVLIDWLGDADVMIAGGAEAAVALAGFVVGRCHLTLTKNRHALPGPGTRP